MNKRNTRYLQKKIKSENKLSNIIENSINIITFVIQIKRQTT